LLAGTHGGDPAELSMRALYPAYYSIGLPSAGAPKPTFLSFRRGMGTLIDAVAGRLERTRVHLEARIGSLTELDVDITLLAIPANHAAKLLDGEARGLLRKIEHRSSTIVTLAYPQEAVEGLLHGTGFLVPPTEGGAITGATWSSSKWVGRAANGQSLIRIFMRGPEQTTETARNIESLLGITGNPILSQEQRWDGALPQYKVGHLDLIDQIESALPSNVFVAGTSYRGVGVPDCVRQGREVAAKMIESL